MWTGTFWSSVSFSTPFCGTIMALYCSHLNTTHMSGHRDKGSFPTAAFVSSKGFCYARVYVYAHTVRAQHAHTEKSNSNRGVLTLQCHVYNSISPGCSVMKKMLLLSLPLFSSGICQLSTASTQLKCEASPEEPLINILLIF